MRRIVILLISSFTLLGCEKIERYSLSTNDAIFETLWSDFDTHYALFIDRGIDWDSLYTVYRPKVSNDISQDSLWNVCVDMLAHFKDDHVALSNLNSNDYSKMYFNSNSIGHNFMSFSDTYANVSLNSAYHNKINDYLRSITNQEGSIGYIHITSFDQDSYPIDDIDRLVESVKHCKSVIIDVRENGGGMSSYAFCLASYFAPNNDLVHYTQKKMGSAPNDFGRLIEHRNIYCLNNLSNKPIVVLTNSNTVSAAERFVLCSKQFKSVIQIGDTTAGSLCISSMTRFLPNGWTYTYSAERVLMPDKTSIEGVGCTPDIYADNDYGQSYFPLTDLVIDAALNYLKENFDLEWYTDSSKQF